MNLCTLRRNDRIAALLTANCMFYVIVLTLVLGLAFFGVRIDSMLAVEVIFYAFPKGFFSGALLAGAFNLYRFITE